MKHYLFPSLFLLIFILTSPSMIYAINNSNTVKTNTKLELKNASAGSQLQNRVNTNTKLKDQIQAKKDEIVQNRCNIVKQNVQNRIQSHQQIRERYQNTYQRIIQNTQTKIKSLQEAGCSGSEMDALSQDITTLQFKVSQFQKEYDALLAVLEQNSQVACSENPNIGQAQQKIRDQLRIMRENTSEIKNFIQSTFKVHLQSLKQACYKQLTNDASKE